jgi:hypothetical protein
MDEARASRWISPLVGDDRKWMEWKHGIGEGASSMLWEAFVSGIQRIEH